MRLAELFTDSAYTFAKEEAVVFVYDGNAWHCLGKNHEDCLAFPHAQVKLAWYSDGALFHAFPATSALVSIDEPGFLNDLDHKIARRAFDFLHF
jgi:hypothetical protein